MSDPKHYKGYSLNKHYTRMTVWHFAENHQLLCTLKYSYSPPKGQRRISRMERFEMLCEFLRQNEIAIPAFKS